MKTVTCPITDMVRYRAWNIWKCRQFDKIEIIRRRNVGLVWLRGFKLGRALKQSTVSSLMMISVTLLASYASFKLTNYMSWWSIGIIATFPAILQVLLESLTWSFHRVINFVLLKGFITYCWFRENIIRDVGMKSWYTKRLKYVSLLHEDYVHPSFNLLPGVIRLGKAGCRITTLKTGFAISGEPGSASGIFRIIVHMIEQSMLGNVRLTLFDPSMNRTYLHVLHHRSVTQTTWFRQMFTIATWTLFVAIIGVVVTVICAQR